MLGQQMIEAGADMKLTYDTSAARWDNYDANDPKLHHYACEALHHVLYTTANTKAMNHAMPGSVYKDGPQTLPRLCARWSTSSARCCWCSLPTASSASEAEQA